MNKVFLIGRLTKDPELRYTSSNVAAASFSIAVDRQYSNQNGERGVDFINIVAWRKTAELVKNYLVKGSQVAIDGRIQTRNYDAQDGTKRYVTEVVADNVQFLARAGSGTSSNYQQPPQPSFTDNTTPYDFAASEPSSAPVTPTSNDSSIDPFKDFGSSIEIDDNELPF